MAVKGFDQDTCDSSVNQYKNTVITGQQKGVDILDAMVEHRTGRSSQASDDNYREMSFCSSVKRRRRQSLCKMKRTKTLRQERNDSQSAEKLQ